MKTLFLTIAVLCAALSTADAACNPTNPTGTIDCPVYTAPQTTSVPRASMGGNIFANGAPTVLFNGAVPPNGFMVQINQQGSLGNLCWVNDNGPASGNPPTAGFLFGGWNTATLPTSPSLFVTPPGYKPIGPVSVLCFGGAFIEYRGW